MELQRSPHLVLYWREDRLVLHNYALDRTVAVRPLVVDVLEQFESWKPIEAYLRSVPSTSRDAACALMECLVRDRWLWRRDEPLLPAERAMNEWRGWNPAAGFFHRASRRVEIVGLDDLL